MCVGVDLFFNLFFFLIENCTYEVCNTELL